MASVYVAKRAFTEEMWNRPLSDFMPEFAAQVEKQGLYTGLRSTRWNEITPFALASQISGLGSALAGPLGSAFDTFSATFGGSFEAWITAGMPSSFSQDDLLDPKYVSQCALTNVTACTSEDYTVSLAWRDAFRLPFTEPAYSNPGFILFGVVMERLTNKTIDQLYQEYLIQPLGLKSTFIVYPGNQTTNNCSNCVVTGDFTTTFELASLPGWAVGSGGLITSLDDLAAIGISILNSTLLTPVETRKWLKPVSHTSNLEYSVGAPWEITRYTNPLTGKITDLYPKNGDSGSAAAQFVLIPDYDIGFSILLSSSVPAAAGINKSVVVSAIADLLLDTIMPAIEAQATKEALQKFAGTYTATDLNSSITITHAPEYGLNVTKWISNGTDLCVMPYLASLSCPFSLQQSSDIRSSSSSAGQVAFRTSVLPSGVIASEEAAKLGLGLFSRQWAVSDWFLLGGSYTAGIGSDLFIFNAAEGGDVTSMSPAALRITLDKQRREAEFA